MFAHPYNIIIDRGVRAPGYGREVVDGLNAIEKNIFMLMTTVKLPGTVDYHSHMAIHSSTLNIVISLVRGF